MKTAKEWVDEVVEGSKIDWENPEKFVAQIQSDALRHAARLSESVGDSIGKDRPSNGELSDSESDTSCGAYMAASRICLEADKLTDK